MEKELCRCDLCGHFAEESRGTGFYRLASKIYCSLTCYGDYEKDKKESQNTKASVRDQAHKDHKRSKKVQSKRKQSKKGKRN